MVSIDRWTVQVSTSDLRWIEDTNTEHSQGTVPYVQNYNSDSTNTSNLKLFFYTESSVSFSQRELLEELRANRNDSATNKYRVVLATRG